MYRRFTLESDVWSFGVVLWEIYSFGKQPHFGHNNEEVVRLILQGILLIPPDGCPPFVCDLMVSCWKTEPRDRITFPQIYERLLKEWESQKQFAASGVSLPRPPDLPVANIPHPVFEIHELLDSENYLTPTIRPVPEYLKTIPD